MGSEISRQVTRIIKPNLPLSGVYERKGKTNPTKNPLYTGAC